MTSIDALRTSDLENTSQRHNLWKRSIIQIQTLNPYKYLPTFVGIYMDLG